MLGHGLAYVLPYSKAESVVDGCMVDVKANEVSSLRWELADALQYTGYIVMCTVVGDWSAFGA